VSLLDPNLPRLGILGAACALIGLLGARAKDKGPAPSLLALLAWGFALGAAAEPEFRADSGGYYEYLRSAVFDRDLDFTNERETWGLPLPARTTTGLPENHYAVGSALFWSPFFALGHLYVFLSSFAYGDLHRYAASGFTDPYYRSAAMGTITIGLLGAALLSGTLARRFSRSVSILAVAASVVASPMLYYLFVVPTMAHGLVFGFSCLTAFALVRVSENPSTRSWALLGASIGALTLTRWQGAVYLLPVGIIVVRDLVRGRLGFRHLASFAASGLVVFAPQLLAWRILFGQWITVPQGSAFFLSYPRYAWDVLVHADHGFFNWTPGMLVATVGLIFSVCRFRLLGAAGLLVLAATICVNGGITDWHGSDAFGSRRFDLVIPFMALGLAMTGDFLVRRPLVAPALLVGLLGLWNAGLIGLVRRGQIRGAAPIERVGELQGRQLHQNGERLLGAVAGQRGYALAYKVFVGEYLYQHLLFDGTIDLATAESRFLASGWSEPRLNRDPSYRWALYPESCLRLPLAEPFEMRTSVLLRTPPEIPRQNVTLSANGRYFANRTITSEWSEIEFTVPADLLRGGENFLCLRFEQHLPGDPAQRISAAVSRIQLP
jgi:hypothetical protein